MKSPRELFVESTLKLELEVCVTSRLVGPLVKDTAPEPPVTVNLRVSEPPFLRIERAGGEMSTTQGAGVGDGDGDGDAAGVGDASGVGLGVGVGSSRGSSGVGSGVGDGDEDGDGDG